MAEKLILPEGVKASQALFTLRGDALSRFRLTVADLSSALAHYTSTTSFSPSVFVFEVLALIDRKRDAAQRAADDFNTYDAALAKADHAEVSKR